MTAAHELGNKQLVEALVNYRIDPDRNDAGWDQVFHCCRSAMPTSECYITKSLTAALIDLGNGNGKPWMGPTCSKDIPDKTSTLRMMPLPASSSL